MFHLNLGTFYIRRFVRYYTKPSTYYCEKLSCRSLIRLSGETAAEYLQGLITNDINHIINGTKNCMYAMFLNAKGRVLYDTIIYKNANDFYLESDKNVTNEFVKHLKMYKIRRKISIDIIDDQFSVWNCSNADTVNNLLMHSCVDDKLILPDLSIFKNKFCSFKDPRCATLGNRLIAEKNVQVASLLNENKISTEPSVYYKKLRYTLGIGEGIDELPPGGCFALESNCDYLHGVSFHKGCYMGQEVTARTHHTGVVRKRLMPLKFVKAVTNLPLDAAVTADNGKSVGKIRGSVDNFGIGLLRVEEVLKSKELIVESTNCKTHRPYWWPVEYSKERPA